MKDAMQTALDFEKKGKDIYVDASQKTKNSFIKKTFEYLAEQEEKHIREIENYFKNKKFETNGDDPVHVKEFFTMTTKEFQKKLDLTEDDMQAHERGLELENESYKFYEQQKKHAEKQEVKQFFDFLMKQEMAHYDLIKKSYEYINDPANFHIENETWFFEG